MRLTTVAARWSAALALAAACAGADTAPLAAANLTAPMTVAGQDNPASFGSALTVTVGKSLIVDSPENIQRVSIGNGDVGEAVAVNPREILINGKGPGETTVVLWQQGGGRAVYNLTVNPSNARLDAARRQLAEELPGQHPTIEIVNGMVFLQGTVYDSVSAERAEEIAASLGKVTDLLHVNVPAAEDQILLKVRFADVDRSASQELGANIISTGALNTPGSISTGQFSPSQVSVSGRTSQFTLTDALNVFLFRPDLNLGATIKALEARSLLQMLAEPNVLAMNGKQASFVSGGEFPFPTLQGGGAGLGAVTIAFREFGVRINFIPTITPRGTIRLQVMPEVSSLDFSNGLVFQGFTIPALATRRVQTEVELASGQSFAIAGLLDHRFTESLDKIPGIGDIPLLGKLFRSRSQVRSNSELLVLITPELVRPIPAGKPVPEIHMPREFLPGTSKTPPQTPGMDVTGPVPVRPPQPTIPIEELRKIQKQGQPGSAQGGPGAVQFVPVPVAPPSMQDPNPGVQPSQSLQGAPVR